MINKIARMLGHQNQRSDRSDATLTRRSLLARATQASAGALVAGSAASTITLRSNAQVEDPCDTCYRIHGCPDFEVAYYCDEWGQGRKCCSCGEDIYQYVCATYCVDWPVNCARLDD